MANKDYVQHAGPVPTHFNWPAVRAWMQRMSRITETRDVMGGSPTIRCRVSVASSTVTVLAAKNIAAFVRQSKGRYTMTSSYLFTEDFTFEFMGTARNDDLDEVSRTAQSVTFVTKSGEDADYMDIQMVQVDIYNLGTSPNVLTSPWIMLFGDIDGNTSGAFTPASPSVGTTFATPAPLPLAYGSTTGSGFKGAIAYADPGTVLSTLSATFTYHTESELSAASANGGVMIGCRWNNAGQTGVFATVIAGIAASPIMYIFEMYGGAWAGVQLNSATLTLTPSSSYTLTLADSGTGLTASITDDGGAQSASITTSNGNTNQLITYGWVDNDTAGHQLNSTISAEPV